MFTTKSFIEIARSMLGQMRSSQRHVTDFNVGAVARTMLEAPASEFDLLYQQMAAGIVEGVATAIYRSFDFEFLPAVFASGVVRFTARPGLTEPTVIPMGFMVSTTNGLRFQTVETKTIPVGQSYVDVQAVALEAGPTSNIPAGSITRTVSSGLTSLVLSVVNQQPFGNGRGLETDGERKNRFIDYVKALARGTPHSLVYGAKLAGLVDSNGKVVERVMRAIPDETTGYFGIYVYNGTGSTSPMLVAAAQQIIDGYYHAVTGLPVPGWAPAGMSCRIIAMTETRIDAAIEVQVPINLRTEALRAAIQDAMGAVIRAVPNSGRLRPLDLLNAALVLDAVRGGDLITPTLTRDCPISAVLVPGDLQVIWAA